MTDKLSPLHSIHVDAGASFTEFGGWQMPVSYGSDLAEHHAVRNAAGIFDISHMAEFQVTGTDAAAYLDFALAVDAQAIGLSRAKYTLLLAEDGGIIDDLIVYQNAPGEYLVVANAGNRFAVAEALEARLGSFNATLVDLTEQVALIAVQGPRSREILERTAGLDHRDELSLGHTLESLPYYACTGMAFGEGSVLVARTGYTGEDGFELYVDVPQAVELWTALVAAGSDLGLVPAGLAARDTLRLEAGMPLYGHELSRDIQPAQAGLARVGLPAKKSSRFVGREAIEAGPPDGARVLVGLTTEGRRAGRAGYEVYASTVPEALEGGTPNDSLPSRASGNGVVGTITSGALSPTLGHPIAMAFVDPGVSQSGTELFIDVRGTRIPATIVPLPFYKREAK